MMGLRDCVAFNDGEKFFLDVLLIPIAILLCIIVYLSYLRMKGREYHKKILLISFAAFVVIEIPFVIVNFDKLF